jgi:hypothetical protein
VESSKFKRCSTSAEVTYQMDNGRPLPVLLHGSEDKWRAGVIIVYDNHWCFNQMDNGRPLPVLLHGSEDKWRAGVIIVCDNHWCFKEIVFPRNGDCVVDNFGLTFHRVHSPDLQLCFGKIDGEAAETLGEDNLPFWGHALAFADLIEDTDRFCYAVVRSGWQHLNAEHIWSEHD